MAPHILVVGGTGMLSGFVKALASDGGRLSLLSRHASRVAGDSGFDCDYYDTEAFTAALAAAVERSGPVDLAIAWFHSLKIAAPRLLAEQVDGRLFQVLGSATADPGHPDRLARAASVVEGLPACGVRQIVLGFKLAQGEARWLTNAEISQGVLEAVTTDRALTIVGQVEPWSARP